MGALEDAVRQAIDAVPALDADTDIAAVRLAITYAESIDAGGNLEKLGPALLSNLDALGLTPRARGAKGGPADDAPSPLDELRARRAARLRDPSAVDATTP